LSGLIQHSSPFRKAVLPFGKGFPLFEKEELPPLKKGDKRGIFGPGEICRE